MAVIGFFEFQTFSFDGLNLELKLTFLPHAVGIQRQHEKNHCFTRICKTIFIAICVYVAYEITCGSKKSNPRIGKYTIRRPRFGENQNEHIFVTTLLPCIFKPLNYTQTAWINRVRQIFRKKIKASYKLPQS